MMMNLSYGFTPLDYAYERGRLHVSRTNKTTRGETEREHRGSKSNVCEPFFSFRCSTAVAASSSHGAASTAMAVNVSILSSHDWGVMPPF